MKIYEEIGGSGPTDRWIFKKKLQKKLCDVVKKTGVALPELIVSPSFPSGNLGCMTEGVGEGVRGEWVGMNWKTSALKMKDFSILTLRPKFLYDSKKILQN